MAWGRDERAWAQAEAAAAAAAGGLHHPSARQLEGFLEVACGIPRAESDAYARALRILGVQAPHDLTELREGEFPHDVKLLHRRRIISQAAASFPR